MFPVLLSILLAMPGFVSAEVPDWVKNQGKSMKYDELRYLTGFGLAKLDKNGDKADHGRVRSGHVPLVVQG